MLRNKIEKKLKKKWFKINKENKKCEDYSRIFLIIIFNIFKISNYP
jgi:hypothetical protein